VCCGWPTPPTAHSNRFQLFQHYPDIQFHALPIVEPGLVTEDENDVAFDSYAYYNKIILHSAVLRPTSRGHVTINSSDPLQPPLIFNNTIYSERDIDIGVYLQRGLGRRKLSERLV
jgi:hypothetical protein